MTHTAEARPGLARGLWALCRYETLLFLREPAAVFFTMLFPQALLLFVGVVYGDQVTDGHRYIDEYLPSVIAIVACNLGLLGVAFNITEARVAGILVRYRLTPLPFWCYLFSQVVIGAIMFLISVGSLFITQAILYGIRFGGSVPVFLCVVVLSLAPMFLLGLTLGGLSNSVRTTQMAGTAAFFFLMFSSGAVFDRDEFPTWLQYATVWNPLTPVLEVLTRAYLGRSLTSELLPLAVLTLLALAAAVAAHRKFRWEVVR
ncbi:ABC transporter permease [Phytohabitans rumicis]|uniref:Transport permease protein n=1 Tax=Phytohabitans rumicis TaxID=1076125 RepID=A0A6V8LKQ3_9ACTN|nr:ABC transporter permease [Phytohabitans rumicis]GFJ94647.1 transport permease protein [Phytohabitans rumicis]